MKWLAVTKRQAFLSISFLGLASLLWIGGTLLLKQRQTCLPQEATPELSRAKTSSAIRSNQLSLLSYNLQLRPRLLFSSRQSVRGHHLIPFLRGYDTLILSEAFDDYVLQEIIGALASEYPYTSQPLESNKGLDQDSGLAIISRWNIQDEQKRLFHGSCDGLSCFNEQGFLIVTINKNGTLYRLLSAQFQAGSSQSAKTIRQNQIQQLQNFMSQNRLLDGPPILFAASLPISQERDPIEYAQLISSLGLEDFPTTDVSVDPRHNTLVQSVRPSTPDAVFTFKSQHQPRKATLAVQPFRVPQADGWRDASWMYWQCPQQNLSDHYAIEGKFEYE